MINSIFIKKPKLLSNMCQHISTFLLPEASKNLFQNIFTEELSYLINLFKSNNYEIKVAGGAVRDILMGISPHDIDFATDATPTEMKDLFAKHDIRIINANGESHGTITPRINDKENFEITTLRIDKVTDGRRAEVVFTKDWKIDAERRDLTINSMFLDMDGLVYDYFDGKKDIDTRTVRFVGDAAQRIQEDYLRILRYFRFYGRIAENPDEHLTTTVDTIREYGAGLQRVSGERIWMELRKIVSGNFAPEILEKMQHCEILPYIGLPKNPDLSRLKNLFQTLKRNECHPAIILSTIFDNKAHLEVAFERLKFSKDELTLLLFMVAKRDTLASIAGAKDDAIMDHCKDMYMMHTGEPPLAKLRLCLIEYLKYIDRWDLAEIFAAWKAPTFPIRGDVLSTKWQIKGRRLGEAMAFLRLKWKKSGYGPMDDSVLSDVTLKEEFLAKSSSSDAIK